MELIEVKLSELTPYKNNPRKNKGAIAAVAESIKQCGYIQPIVVDENLEILAGHTRYEALKRNGVRKAIVTKVTGLTDVQKQKYRVLDNKTGEFAAWDFAKLDLELDGLNFQGFDFGFEEIPVESYEELKEEPQDYVSIKFTLHNFQKEMIETAMDLVRGNIHETFGNQNKNGNAIYEVVRQWAEQKR